MLKRKISISKPLPECYVLLALSSLEPDYRLAWLLSSYLKIMLQRNKSVSGRENLQFSVFTSEESAARLRYTLVSNKNKQDGAVLLREYPAVDFFLKVSGEITTNTLTELRAKIKDIAEISACIPCNTKKTNNTFFNNVQ